MTGDHTIAGVHPTADDAEAIDKRWPSKLGVLAYLAPTAMLLGAE